MPRNPSQSTRVVERATLIVVLLAAIVLVVYKVRIAIDVGPGWDTYAFLNNAAEFAGRGTGYTELHRPPFLSWLTALAFRAGGPFQESVIQWLDGLLSLSGLVAFYLLYRRRVSPILAGLGVLATLAVSPLWLYLGSGYTDLPSVALSGWLLVAVISATERSPWWYLVAGTVFVLSVLTRYTALLAAFPAAVWILLRWHPFRQARYIGGAFIAAIAAYLPAGRMYATRFGDSLFPFVVAFGVAEVVSAPGGEGAVTAAAPYYLSNVLLFLGGGRSTVGGLLLLFVAVVGLLQILGSHLETLRARPGRIMLALLGVGIGIGAQLFGGIVSRQIAIAVAVLLVWNALAPRETADNKRSPVRSSSALDAAMLAWLLAYFSFHGHQTIQVPRYIITMTPPLMYFIVFGWQRVAESVRETLAATLPHDRPGAFEWIPLLVSPAVFALVTAAALAIVIADTNHDPDRLVAAARDTSATLLASQDDIDNVIVYSDLWPLTSWYAQTHARAMPFFAEEEGFSHELDKSGADFYVTIKSRRFDDFEASSVAGPATILTRTDDSAPDLPRVVLLGTAWDNYLETVTGYDFYLDGDAGRYGWEGTAFMDGLTPEELASYDAVALFDVRWRQRVEGERRLAEYVSRGGTLIIDASANVGSLPYEMGGTVVLDTVVRRTMLPPTARIEIVSTDFAKRYPKLEGMTTEPFVDEGGGDWFGAEYESLRGFPDLDVIAQANGRPIVATQRMGQGQIYWIGHNLVWHSFYTESRDEQALIRAVFDDALTGDER